MNKSWKFLSFLRRGKRAERHPAASVLLMLERRMAVVEHSVARAAASRQQYMSGERVAQSGMPAIADLLVHLPRLKTTAAGNVDFAASDATLLTTLADNADTAYKIVLRGVAAMGSLMAHSGPEIDDGSLSADTVEAIGMLLAELGELSGMLVALQGNCRRVTDKSFARRE